MLHRLFGIAVIGSVLGGCAVPNIEQVAPYSVVTIDQKPELVMAGLSGEQCGFMVYAKARAYSAERFEVQYFTKSWIDIPSDLVFGALTPEGKTELTMKSLAKLQEPYSAKMVRKLLTGKCE